MRRGTAQRITAGLVMPAAVVAAGLTSLPAHAAGSTDIEARKRAATVAPEGSREAAGAARITEAVPETTGDTVNLVVGFKPGVTAKVGASKLGAAGLKSSGNSSLDRLGVRTVAVPRDRSAKALASLRANPAVAYVEEDGPVHADAVTPNDPFYRYQTEMPQITVPDAWSVTTGSAQVVAVVDTGVTAYGDLAGKVLAGYDFVNKDKFASDDQGHGTAVSSIIAGRGNNSAGMAGVCWSCKILPVKVLNAKGSGTQAGVASGIVYAADRGAKIINASLSGPADVTALKNAVAYAQRKGALVVASAGNDAVGTKQYPAAYPGVLSVGGTDSSSDYFVALDENDKIYGSNHGPDWVDVAAPWCTVAANWAGFRNDTGGVDTGDDRYTYFCGTSASAPLVAGTAALQKSRHPRATAASMAYSLAKTAKATPTPNFSRWGEIRAGRAVATVDTTVPRITGASPANGKRFRGAITVGASGVSDAGGSGLSHVALYANGKYVGRDNTAPFAVRYHSGKANGTITLQWRAYDRAGNFGTFTRKVIADNKAPAASFAKAPKNGAKVKGTVSVKAGASDASGIARVELIINGKVVSKDVKSPYTFKIKVSKYGKKLKVQLRAVDKVGNTKTVTRTWKR